MICESGIERDTLRDAGYAFLNGDNVPVDYASAEIYLNKAAEMGDSDVMGDLAVLYCTGDMFPLNLELSKYWALKASEDNVEKGVIFLYNTHKLPELKELYDALYDYASIYVVNGDIDDEVKEAFRTIEQCAISGDSSAMGRLCILCGEKHRNEILPTNAEYAIGLLTECAKKGSSAAQYWLGNIYNGKVDSYFGFLNKAKAAYWFEKCANSGSSKDSIEAKVNLAVLCSKGEGVPLDNNKQLTLLNEAAAHGSERANVMLANMYIQGEVVTRDWTQAKKHIMNAMAGNDEKQKAFAEILYGILLFGEDKNADAKRYLEKGLGSGLVEGELKKSAERCLSDIHDELKISNGKMHFSKKQTYARGKGILIGMLVVIIGVLVISFAGNSKERSVVYDDNGYYEDENYYSEEDYYQKNHESADAIDLTSSQEAIDYGYECMEYTDTYADEIVCDSETEDGYVLYGYVHTDTHSTVAFIWDVRVNGCVYDWYTTELVYTPY